jgi:hypothetical protein
MQFDTNTSNRSSADTCRKTDRLTDGEADITKPVVDYTGQQNLTLFLSHEEKYLILIERLTLNSNV